MKIDCESIIGILNNFVKHFAIPFSLGILIGNSVKSCNKNSNTQEPESEVIESLRDSIKDSEIKIDSVHDEIIKTEHDYYEKADSVYHLSDDSSLLFFREYVKPYQE